MEINIRELLSIAADIATIITAFAATSIAIKTNIKIGNIGQKNTDQVARGNNNKQSIKQ